MRYTLKQLRYCLAAAQSNSVTRAAEQMNVSQPSISAAISHLEDTFNIQIFIRHHAQGLSLTPAGRRLIQEATRFMNQAESLESYAKELGDSVTGNLDVGCISTVAAIAMPNLMRTFYFKFPGASINCLDGNQEQLFEGLQDGRFELAMTYDLQLDNCYRFEPLVQLPAYAILPLDHPLAESEQLSLTELAGHPMVMLDLPLSREYFRSLFLSVGKEPKIAYRAKSLEMVRSLVGNGFGYSLANVHLHHSMARQESYAGVSAVDGTRYRSIPLSDELLPLRFGMIMLKDVQLTRLADCFADYCRGYWKDQH
ncbi:LysR family transcriptional regulator [Pseudomaricurvus alkylphenolicus]|uniref:LysR family transcriptional regulator n=1 Tax=Pseudomaricurvus alkylphenolicus TaxID=1306991 RepID=UPI001423C049|nr:LysR family transcriptional regulator [Pseudomaricurvus alkylphenolicus]NIB41081.1 LysR family transcriptional regulator [Pseudomaricurvus alkylphenolicus]